MDAGEMAATVAPPALPFRTYEEYLESQVTAWDLYYLESEAVGRQLVELGFRGSGDVLRREEFEARAAAAAGLTAAAPQNVTRDKEEWKKVAAWSGKKNPSLPSKIPLQNRYEAPGTADEVHNEIEEEPAQAVLPRSERPTPHNKTCIKTSIEKKQRFYNWDRNVSTSNSSPNYQVVAANACGLLFKSKSDRKIINVDPKAYPGDDTTQTPVETDLCLHVVIYDHIIRRGT